MRYRLGLDIGIASVGWCLVNSDDEIIKAGVRIFPEGGSDENQKRRARRGGRRLLRRRQFRLERIKRLLLEFGIIDSLEYDFYENGKTPYHFRKKGLYEKLDSREFAVALYHLGKHRGAGEFSIEEKSSSASKEEKGTKEILRENEAELSQGKYVCEVQLERIEKKIRGVNNNFKTSNYVEEAKKIIETQGKYYTNIGNQFLEKYIEILEGRRKYYEGPGQSSPYSWKNQEEWMEGLMGKCTYFPEEIRMVKTSYSSQLFNILNDLNNLKIKREENQRLTTQEKRDLVDKLFKTVKNVTLKRIAKELGVNPEDITGYRIDKNETPQFSSLDCYIDINKIIKCEDREKIDEICKIATYYQDENNRTEKLKELLANIDGITEENIKELAKIHYTGSHSLSKKAILLAEPFLFETNKNQMAIFTEELKKVPYKMDFTSDKIKKIPKNYVENWILSPTVKRSMIQSINIVNEIVKKYGVPEEIVIELAREKNSADKKKTITDIQKRNEKENKEITELLDKEKVSGKAFELIKYWKSQDGRCMYSGEKIGIDEIKNNPNAFEIDHIIPRSISFDNSRDNKVFVKRDENQRKKQRTPYGYFNSGETNRSYEQFKAQVLDMVKNKQISLKKRDLLLLEEDITKYVGEFIARNLVDTRYSTRELLNLLRTFFRDKNQHVKIKAVKGSFTSFVRGEWKMKKIREINHNHHAQDAYIVLMAEKCANKLKWVKNSEISEEERVYFGQNDILSDDEFRNLFNYRYSKKIKEYKDYVYSHFVDKKPNRQLCDETLYSTRIFEDGEYVIGKISNIYDKKSTIAKKFTTEKEQKSLLIYHNDRQTFDILLKIYEEYSKKSGNENPFFKYFEEFGAIKKYSKKGNGPEIYNLKYRTHKLGNHLDISHKYNVKNKKVLMESIKSFRADFYYNGKEYKFIAVTYLMLRDKGDCYVIDMEKYLREKGNKKIGEEYQYQFSLYTGDIISIKYDDGTTEKIKFKSINNDTKNIIEIDDIHRGYAGFIRKLREIKEKKEKDINYDYTVELSEIFEVEISKEDAKDILTKLSSTQKVMSITKKITNLKKHHINILGQEYNANEKFENIIKK